MENFEIGQNAQNIKKDTTKDGGKFERKKAQLLENRIERNVSTSKYLCHIDTRNILLIVTFLIIIEFSRERTYDSTFNFSTLNYFQTANIKYYIFLLDLFLRAESSIWPTIVSQFQRCMPKKMQVYKFSSPFRNGKVSNKCRQFEKKEKKKKRKKEKPTGVYKNINDQTQTIIRLLRFTRTLQKFLPFRRERSFFPLEQRLIPFRRMFAGSLRDSTLKRRSTKKGEDFTAS